MINDRAFWTAGIWLGGMGFLATFITGMVLDVPEHGHEASNAYLMDDLAMIAALLAGTIFLGVGSALNRDALKQIDRNEITPAKAIDTTFGGPVMLMSMIAGGALLAGAIYAFDVAFFEGNLMGADRPHAGPDTLSEKIVFSALYAFMGLVGLMTLIGHARLLLVDKVTRPIIVSAAQNPNDNPNSQKQPLLQQ